MLWWLLGFLALPLVTWAAFSVRRLLSPPRHGVPLPDPCPPFTRHPLRASDGTSFEVWRLSPSTIPRGRVLLMHGYYANRAQIVGIGDGLRAHGYDVLLLELRGHGDRPGPFTFGVQETEDVGAVLRWTRTVSGAMSPPVAVLGISMGGAVMCQAAARFPEVRAVVLDSVYSRCFPIIRRAIRSDYHLPSVPWAWVTWWGLQLTLRTRLGALDPETLAPRLRQPLLAIQGGADQRLVGSLGEEFYARWAGPKERWFEPQAAHAALFLAQPQVYCERVVAFLQRALSS